MKKQQINKVLTNQAKRRNTVLAYCFIIFIVFVLILSFLIMYFQSGKSEYVNYKEKSNIDYQVYYKKNDFFDTDYLPSNKQYIASLINQITANFQYEMFLSEQGINYKYNYRIEANVRVQDKDNKNVFYEKKEELLSLREISTSADEFTIDENIIIDYKKYNDLIKNFVNVYELEKAESFLDINLYVNVVGSCENFEDNKEKERVITLSIPLTEDTLAITFADNLVNSSNNVMKCNDTSGYRTFLMSMAIILVMIEIYMIISIIRYEYKTRTAETIYEKELKKILNNYGSSIQMLSNNFDFKNYQLLKIETFSDILEISDKLRQPILMKESKEKNSAYFVIPSNTNLLYVYRLNISNIKEKMNKKMK